MGNLRIRNWNWQSVISHRWSRSKSESAQALVELALTMPVLCLLLLGAAEMARVAYAAIEVSNAARAGVQYGAQSAITASDTVGIQNAAINDAPDVTLSTPSVAISCICSDGSASTCLRTDCSTSHIEEILSVKTQATFDPLIYPSGLSTKFTLHGQATQKVLQ